jgi:hypothetical protein
MKDFLFVSDRLEDISRELGVSNYSGFLEEAQRKIKRIIVDETFHIDIIFNSGSSSDVRKLLASFKESVKTDSLLSINEITEKTELVRVFENFFSSIAIVLFDEDVLNESILLNRIKHMSDEYKVVIFINFYDDETFAKQIAQTLNSTSKSFIISNVECKNKKLSEVLNLFIEADRLAQLKKLTSINSIKPVFCFLNEIFESENKVVQTRKLLNTQNSQITRKEEIGYNVTELASSAKQNLQKLMMDLEKNYKLKYDELNKPNTGHFSQQSLSLTERLKDFDKRDLAEKSERVAIVIKKDFLTEFNDEIITNLKKELTKDEAFIKSSIEELVNRINHQLNLKGLSIINFEEVTVPFPDQDRVVRSFCYFSKQFTGELMKRGVTEYFVALRDYIGVIMVATGLLAPLNIIARIAGSDEKGTSFWRVLLNELSTYVRLATAIIAFLLIVFGIFDLKKRIPRKREEEFERELNKAKEILQNEAKRMYNESSREWISNIVNWIKEVNQNINQQLEKNIKEFQNSKIAQGNTEKQQQLRLQQSIDLIQRNIQSAEKVKDQLSMKFRDVVMETEKDLNFS